MVGGAGRQRGEDAVDVVRGLVAEVLVHDLVHRCVIHVALWVLSFVVVLEYHEWMTVPRQGKSSETGRVNQKRRTRAAIVEAAQAMLQEGVTPTVAQAAEAALVSRTTAYRYFPTQESLLVELSVNLDVADIEELVAQPVDAEGAVGSYAVDVLDRFNRHVHTEERQYRTALGLYQDQWLEAVNRGDDAPVVREGRRGRWLEYEASRPSPTPCPPRTSSASSERCRW